MAFEFRLPDIGEGVVEGEIVKWHVHPGDSVAEDQPMVEVMTDKATVVIPSPKAGKILETRGAEGEIAKVDDILVVIEELGAPAASAERAAPPPAEAQAHSAPASKSPPKEAAKVLAAPATRRLARELGVDLGSIVGTGPGGRVTTEDVRAATAQAGTQRPREEGAGESSELNFATSPGMRQIEATLTPVPVEVRGTEKPSPAIQPNLFRKTLVPRTPVPLPAADRAELSETVPVRGIRGRIWDAMTMSKHTAAHFTFVEECDSTELVALRKRFNERRDESEPKISFLPFIVKAVIAALRRFPDLNGHVDDENRAYVRRYDYHIGIAAATERGLIVPVIRHADRRSIVDLAAEIERLSRAAREATITTDDLGGSTFTITSLGREGGIFATPIINYPEVAIMGVHKMIKRPVVIEDDQIVIRDVMNLSLSFDHRVIDGHVGAAFTYAVIKLLEQPDRLLMEMT